MKFFNKININTASKMYITGTIFAILVLFLVTAVIFLFLTADKLPVIMSQPAKETYTYFISIMDRIMAVLIVFIIIPLSIYQLWAKNKSKPDRITSVCSICIFIIMILCLVSGENYYFQKYRNGELSSSKMFCSPTIETKVFDKIIEHNKEIPPAMCEERIQKSK